MIASVTSNQRQGLPRERLADLLDVAAELPLTVVRAPAGYGKTTAVGDWLTSRGRRFSRLAIEPADNEVENLFPRLLEILADLTDAYGEAFSVVLDDFHQLTAPAAHRAVRTLLDRLPGAVQMIVISRTQPPLRLGRLRAAGTLFEVGPEELAFTVDEAEALLNGRFCLELTASQLDEVRASVAGWPAGLALVAGSLPNAPDRLEFGRGLGRALGRIGQYLREEVMQGCGRELRDFLLRTSILDRLHPSLCAAVLEDARAGELLAEAREAELLVAEPTGRDGWVRVQGPFAVVLRRELAAQQAELLPRLHARASRWYEEAGIPEEAIRHASLCGDGRRAAALVHQAGDGLLDSHRYRQIGELIGQIPADRGEFGPYCRALGVMAQSLDRGNPRVVYEELRELRALNGDAPGVARLIDRALISPFFGRIGTTAVEGRDFLSRAATEPLAERAVIAVKLGLVEWFDGDTAAARRLLEDHLDAIAGRRHGLALAGLALVATDEGHPELAVERAAAALDEVARDGGEIGLEGAFFHQALANGLIAAGRHEEADAALRRAEAVTARLPVSLHHGFTQILRAELELRRHDRDRARRSAEAARTAIDAQADAGVLPARLAEVDRILAEGAGGELRGSLPTRSEQRVLELLERGLTFNEVAADLYVSVHTVKSHARRLYRRLGVNSRGDAVEVARERGLLGGAPGAEAGARQIARSGAAERLTPPAPAAADCRRRRGRRTSAAPDRPSS
jgi:LuxR family maltose regulon positive regulatory protein